MRGGARRVALRPRHRAQQRSGNSRFKRRHSCLRVRVCGVHNVGDPPEQFAAISQNSARSEERVIECAQANSGNEEDREREMLHQVAEHLLVVQWQTPTTNPFHQKHLCLGLRAPVSVFNKRQINVGTG